MDMRSIKEFLKDTLKYLIVIFVVLFIFLYIFSFQQIVGSSMEPNLSNGNLIFLDKVIYKIKKPLRGDIISFSYSDTNNLIKRVIGLPGEYVSIKNNKIYIDNKELVEYYLKDQINNDFELSSLGYDKIPDNMYFVLGDNRTDSVDSRDSRVGVISSKDIIGKVRFVIWPINKFKVVK